MSTTNEQINDRMNAELRRQAGQAPPAPEVPEAFMTAASKVRARDVAQLYEAAEPYLRDGATIDEIIDGLQSDHPDMFIAQTGSHDAPDMNRILRQMAGKE